MSIMNPEHAVPVFRVGQRTGPCIICKRKCIFYASCVTYRCYTMVYRYARVLDNMYGFYNDSTMYACGVMVQTTDYR